MVCSNCVRHHADMDLIMSPPIRKAFRHFSQNPLVAPPENRSAAAELGEPIFLGDGAMLLLRPIRPGDVAALMRAFKRMTPKQVRARVFHALSELTEPVASAMCRVNPDQAVAFVATDPDGAEIRGEARVHFDPTTASAELAIAVDPAYTGRGLGRILIERLISACRAHGIQEIWGDTQSDNSAMLALTSRLGFSHRHRRDDPNLVRISLELREATPDETALKS